MHSIHYFTAIQDLYRTPITLPKLFGHVPEGTDIGRRMVLITVEVAVPLKLNDLYLTSFCIISRPKVCRFALIESIASSRRVNAVSTRTIISHKPRRSFTIICTQSCTAYEAVINSCKGNDSLSPVK